MSQDQNPTPLPSHHNRNFHPYEHHHAPEKEIDNPLLKKSKRTIVDHIVLVIFLIALVFSGYLAFEKLTIHSAQKKLEDAITKKEKAIEKIETLERIRERFQAEKMLPRLEDYRIEWSDVYKRITEQENYQISFESFKTGRDYQVTVSGVAKSFDDISKLIEDLKKSPYFEGPFVPNINGNNNDSNTDFRFSLDFRFINLDAHHEAIPVQP